MKATLLKFKQNKKLFILGLIIVVGIAGGLYYYKSTSKATPATAQQVVQAERRNLSASVAATGTIQPVSSIDISSKITAQIKEVKVKENDQVKAGQTLVILEDTGLQAEVTQAKEKLDNSGIKYNRTTKMNSIGGASTEELDNARMDYNIAKANYDEVMSRLDETIIVSPMDGTIIGKPLNAGEMVAQGVNNPTVIMTVADMSKIQIQAKVDQTDIGKIALGQRVTFTVDAYPDKEFSGTVSTISRKPVVESNVTYYQVTIDVDNAENLLNPGMVARVTIKVSESNGVLTVPLSAVRTDKTGKYVVVMDQNGQTRNVTVTTGASGDDRVEVTSGLNDGDKVVIAQTKTQTQTGSQQTNQQGSRQGRPMF